MIPNTIKEIYFHTEDYKIYTFFLKYTKHLNIKIFDIPEKENWKKISRKPENLERFVSIVNLMSKCKYFFFNNCIE